MKVLVTGGCGYIGSHTIVDLVQAGYEVICVDSNCRSSPYTEVHAKIKEITGKDVFHYSVDLRNRDELRQVFQENKGFQAVFHFAALKAVGESVENPVLYYQNNVGGLCNLLECIQEFHIPSLVFSSSCTVYGQPDTIPVTEETPIKAPKSPYGATKQMCEQILRDFVYASKGAHQASFLRYFNPAGAHPSLFLGENPTVGVPSLTSAIVKAVKDEKTISIFGFDYTTKDGTCLRDFIHVCDIARAHRLALEHLIQNPQVPVSVFNLGAGKPCSVLEAIRAFSMICSKNFEMEFCPRRPGDVEAIYADCSLAKKDLGWEPEFTLADIMRTAWEYETIQR